MQSRVLLLAVLASGLAVGADTNPPRAAMVYSGASIVNAADNQPGPLAPNTIATIYGTGMANGTQVLSGSDIRGGFLPTVLPGTGVRVFVGGIAAALYYVSPTQINFLVPSILIPGPSDVQVALDAKGGPDVKIQIAASSPAFFQLAAGNAIATRSDGSVVTPAKPARPGDVILLYTTGLGQVAPPLSDREIPAVALRIAQFADLKLTIDGVSLAPDQVLYAGVSPGFGGLYQINLRLPDATSPDPEIRMTLAGQTSISGIRITVQP